MMECDEETPFDVILSAEQDRWLDATKQVKRLVIGSNRQKSAAIQCGILARLLEWLIDESVRQDLRKEAAIVLGSLAWGTEDIIRQLVNAGAVPELLRGLSNPYLDHVEACLRCLRTIFMAADPPVEAIYQNPTTVPHLLSIVSKSQHTKETITNILANCCNCERHQDILLKENAIAALAPLLTEHTLYKIQMPVLKCFAAMCLRNERVCQAVSKATFNGVALHRLMAKLLSRDKTAEMQMAAARCLTYLFRGGATLGMDLVKLETLPTLVRMCKKDRTLEENVEGAETLSYLIQEDPDLQKTTAICDHAMASLADYLSYTDVQQMDARQEHKQTLNLSNALKRSAFQAFAAIGANDEEIRKKIIAIDNLIDSVATGMNSEDEKVQIAACRCLHSLSRSVQQIRTTLQDHVVWKPLVKLMQSESEDVLRMASSTMCNLLLDFSPSKESILECGAIGSLVELSKNEDEQLRLNGVWGLMNVAFNSDQKIKQQIMDMLGPDHLFLLLSEDDPGILMRTLGLLRNLMTRKQHIDSLMNPYVPQALEAINIILCKPCLPPQIKEQTICVVANIADGCKGRLAILNHEDVMERLAESLHLSQPSSMMSSALWAVSNLISKEDEDSFTRIKLLRQKKIDEQLKILLKNSKNQSIAERARQALESFP